MPSARVDHGTFCRSLLAAAARASRGLGAALGMAVLLAAPAAFAKYAVVSEAQFRIEVPDAWEVSRKEQEADDKTWVLHVGSPDRELRVRIRATPVDAATVDLVASLKAYEAEVLAHESEELTRHERSEVEAADGRKTLTAAYGAMMRRKTTVQKYVVMATMIVAKRGWLYSLTDRKSVV